MHPRSRKMYKEGDLKTESQEAKEYTQSGGGTPIIQGDWKLNVHKIRENRLGYRRYHKHGKRWYCVISALASRGELRPGQKDPQWKCGHCSEPVPDEMEGYVNLAEWATDANA
jgi:hypothetical protein